MARSEKSQSPDRMYGERRERRRYNIGLEVRWHVMRRRKVLDSGTGRTLDLSSGGILFDAGRHLPAGLAVEMSIAWPALLDATASLRLVVSGRIVRSDDSGTAVHVLRHEFRTAGGAAEQRSRVAAGRAAFAHPAKVGTFQ